MPDATAAEKAKKAAKIRREKLGLPANATDEQVNAAQRVADIKRLGLTDDATDQQLNAAEKVYRFKNVAKKRTDNALAAMHNLKRCANRANYTFTDEQVETVINALRAEVEAVEAAFSATAGPSKPEVTL